MNETAQNSESGESAAACVSRMFGRLIFLMLALMWLPLLHTFMQREERFLAVLYGDAYRDYCGYVGRYFSWQKYEGEAKGR